MSKIEDIITKRNEKIIDGFDKEAEKWKEYYSAKKDKYYEKYNKLSTEKLRDKCGTEAQLGNFFGLIASDADLRFEDFNPIISIGSVVAALGGMACLVAGAVFASKCPAALDFINNAKVDDIVMHDVNTNTIAYLIGIPNIFSGSILTTIGVATSNPLAKLKAKLFIRPEQKHTVKNGVIWDILDEREELASEMEEELENPTGSEMSE